MQKNKNYKIPADSEIIKTEVVCPNDSNPMGILQGGRLVQWMDIAAAACAQIHAGSICVTVSINHVDFTAAANVGDIITINAKITRAFGTSMEIFVRAFARKVAHETKHLISEAYFTFVALDEKSKPVQVIAVRPVNKSETERYNAAFKRKRKVHPEKTRNIL